MKDAAPITIDAMLMLSLPNRTVLGPAGGHLVAGWTEENKKRRDAEFHAGRKIDYRIEELEVRVFGNVAVTIFYRIDPVKDLNKAAKPSHFRISGVWVRQADRWKLAHRRESNFCQVPRRMSFSWAYPEVAPIRSRLQSCTDEETGRWVQRRASVPCGGRRSLSSNWFTSVMSFAYARVEAANPVGGTTSAVS
jgi:hypothetical protein